MLSGAWSVFSVVVSEAEADDDWDDTDSLLPIEVSSVVRLELSPTADTGMKKKDTVFVLINFIFSLILFYCKGFSLLRLTDDSLPDKTAE